MSVFVWVCLCASEEKEDEERSVRLSFYCTQRREREKKRCESVKLI